MAEAAEDDVVIAASYVRQLRRMTAGIAKVNGLGLSAANRRVGLARICLSIIAPPKLRRAYRESYIRGLSP